MPAFLKAVAVAEVPVPWSSRLPGFHKQQLWDDICRAFHFTHCAVHVLTQSACQHDGAGRIHTYI